MEEVGDHLINLDDQTDQDAIPIYIQFPTYDIDDGAAHAFN